LWFVVCSGRRRDYHIVVLGAGELFGLVIGEGDRNADFGCAQGGVGKSCLTGEIYS
jgi:hypothetical protein